ncbi:GNAT family N-acetyltransferase [Nonomuraea pusilla]|uniref:Protein N-acetyltransferase, RimJ/RimL family n=1 Tax=Nonomuraea pusilla TaxID=46177 RepID=A0A1H8JMN0_9ACTN|nr:GNAT family N-acetyltransferase [Nonomuraea pusilla]SEN82033.1 Protein N-acetyltransferase, RimJ/RimL family [Nonomuraea pusilla]
MAVERRPPAPTERLSLREMTRADLDDMAALLGDPEVMRHYPRPFTREEAARWIESSLRSYEEHGYGLWTVTVRETGEFAGNCGLTRQNVEGEIFTEVGYLVPARLQGRGYATEAALACRDHARDVLGVDRLIAIINPENVPSQRVAGKLGLTFERTAAYNGSRQRIYSLRLRP